MNALFGTVIKVFLTLVQADDAVGEDDGYGANRRDGASLGLKSVIHCGLYRPMQLVFSGWCHRSANGGNDETERSISR